MNCQDFENIMDELTRGALMDARTREAALAHADSCRRCDTRLADERALRAGLRSLAAASGTEAPPRVESALLAAFRAQAATNSTEGVSAPVVNANVTPLARRAEGKKWSWTKTFTAAATAAAAAAILLMIIPPFMDSSPSNSVAEKTKAERTEVNSQVPKTNEHAQTVVKEDEASPSEVVSNVEPLRASGPQRGGSRMTQVSYNSSAGRRAQNQRRPRPAEEVVTEFIPLGNAEYSSSVDAGQVVRVELPRSALASIGMPVSADRASERIKADVLVGEDGLARAIRFVR